MDNRPDLRASYICQRTPCVDTTVSLMPSKNSQLDKITADLRAQRRPCFICGQPIDYQLPHDHPDAFSVEHIKTRSTHPHLVNDPGNCVPAHLRCNKGRGNRDYKPGLGIRSKEW